MTELLIQKNSNNILKENKFENLPLYIKKIKEIRDDVLSNFCESKISKEVTIEEIIQVVFDGDDEIIFRQSKEFVKLFVDETNTIIEKYLNLNLRKKLADENENINDLIDLFDRILLKLNNFFSLKIPKHNNVV